MKNLVVLISIITMGLTLNSCSSDHSTGTVNDVPDTVTLTVDGQVKTFTDVSVVESTVTDTNINETVLTYNVLANSGEDNDEFIAFQVKRNYTGGSGGLYQFIYNNEQGSHSIADNFTFNVTQNQGNVLAGTFSGPLFNDPQEITPSVTVTEGSFNITF